MTSFEEELKRAMARREPSPGFTERVLAEAAMRQRKSGLASGLADVGRWLRGALTWRLAPVLAALLLFIGGGIYREHQREVRGLAAKRQLLTAMRIAGSKLRTAGQRVMEVETTEEQQ
jgi:hypothetical protein